MKKTKEQKLAEKYEKQYGEVGREIEKTIKDILEKHNWVMFSEVFDENWIPVPGRFNISSQFVPKKIADKIVKDRLKHINDQAKAQMSKVVEKKASVKKK